MNQERLIIAIQAPPGADLSPVIPFLKQCGTVELRTPSLAYVEVRPGVFVRRIRKQLLLIRGTIQALLRVSIRIGASTNKIVSLIAARQAAPGGMVIVPVGEESSFLESVVIELLPGIGRRTATYLRNRGINTIGKFSRLPQTAAVRLFGISGIVLREFSRGADPRDVLPTPMFRGSNVMPKSMPSHFSSRFRARSSVV